MAEGNGLLNRHTLSRRIEGSNPSVSATSSMRTPRWSRSTPKNLLVSKAFGRRQCTSETASPPKIGLRTPSVSFQVYLAQIGTLEKILAF